MVVNSEFKGLINAPKECERTQKCLEGENVNPQVSLKIFS